MKDFDTTGMEAPCRCDCGNWFDLHDGNRSDRRSGILICDECYEYEQSEIEKENEIQELRDQIQDDEWTISDAEETIQEARRNIEISKQKLAELTKQPFQ